jgi:hypothetical protein
MIGGAEGQMSSYLLRFNVDTCLSKREDLTLTFKGHSATFRFSKKTPGSTTATVETEVEAKNNREAHDIASGISLPPVLDALSFTTGTPLLLRECELTLKDERGSATRRAIYVGKRLSPSQVRLSDEAIREVEEILANGDDLRLQLCWHRYGLDRKLALEQFVFHWLAFESLAGDADVTTRCPQCQTEVRHCERPVTHRGSNKVAAREIFRAANPDVPFSEFNTRIWGKARNSVFHGRGYPQPKYLVELNDITGLIHKATDKHLTAMLGLRERERAHHGYETWYRHFLFFEWATQDRATRFASDYPAKHLAQMTAEPEPGVAHYSSLEAGIRLLNYQTESPGW